MRISGGILGGRTIPAAVGVVRPTQQMVREALFSMLADRVPDCVFLDLFAGSGLVGLEAWSRGANDVCWVESDPRVYKRLAATVREFCGKDGRTVCGDVFSVLDRLAVDRPFDLIFADPPYGFEEAAEAGADAKRGAAVRRGHGRRERCGRPGERTWERLLGMILERRLLAPDGLLIVETDRPWETPDGWDLIKERRYGKTQLYLLRSLPRET